jgi:O-antigen/teichoic acid export membrane protein
MNIDIVTSESNQFNIKITKLFKTSLVYGLTSSLQSILGFVLLPILTIYYTPEIFGAYSLLLLLSALSSAIFYLGASSALGRFYLEENSDLYRNKIFTTSLIITLIGAFLLISLGLIFAKPLSIGLFETDKYHLPVKLILIATSFGFLLNLMTLLLRYENKAILFFIIIISGILVNFIITYSLLSKFNYGILAPIYGLLISNALSFSALLLIKIKSLTKKLKVEQFKLILSFGIQSSFAGLSFYLLDWIDRLIINELLNLNDVGIYSLGYRLGAIINIFIVVPFSLIWAPMRMQYAKSNNIAFLTSKVMSYYTVVGVLVLLFTILFGEEILKLIFVNEGYSEAFLITPIIMTSLFIYGYQNIVDFGIYLRKKVFFYVIIAVILIIINIILNYVLIPKYGFFAASLVTLITYFLSSTSIFFISNAYFKLEIEIKRVLIPLLTVPIMFLLNYFLIYDMFIVKLFIMTLVFVLFYVFWLNNNERNYLKKLNYKQWD